MRDRLREKELLATARYVLPSARSLLHVLSLTKFDMTIFRKAKLMDDDEGDFNLDSRVASTMVPTTAWRVPSLLPERPDVAPVNLVSQEVITQNLRVRTVLAAIYLSENDVPSRPLPLTEVEQALDMTSQSSAIVQEIPFFIPEPVAPAPEPAPAPVYQALSVPAFDPSQGYQSFVAAQSSGATPEFVQALGLPLFLVGQNVQALQTLASSPGLLTNFVDASGAYDQARLMGLVQTLSVTNGSQPTPSLSYGTASTMYGAPAPIAQYGQSQSYSSQPRGAPRGSSEGNLHVSGYGPSTTEAEIIELFSPYVQVDQVVMKGTFSFVNTSDPLNAQRAKEALAGTLLGGMPIRINPAQRKNTTAYSSSTVAPGGSFSSDPSNGIYGQQGAVASLPAMHVNNPVSDPGSTGQINVDLARDDRGNPATKNLFVAGYGPNTQEQEIRDIFGQYVHVIGVVSKGSFTFVNTTDREAAVRARQALSGTMLNGGVLRINFAKETGRLGTSFDLTYGRAAGPNAQVEMNSNAGQSYYGRGY
jgi:RNA recognition motif-containing protein